MELCELFVMMRVVGIDLRNAAISASELVRGMTSSASASMIRVGIDIAAARVSEANLS